MLNPRHFSFVALEGEIFYGKGSYGAKITSRGVVTLTHRGKLTLGYRTWRDWVEADYPIDLPLVKQYRGNLVDVRVRDSGMLLATVDTDEPVTDVINRYYEYNMDGSLWG